MATITVTVQCDCAYWVTIDQTDVPMHNGQGGVTGVGAGSHGFIWAVLGKPGDAFSAELVDESGRQLLSVVEWKIPDNDDGWCGDYAPFSV